MVKRFIVSVLLLLSSIASAVSLDSDRPWLSISDPNIMSSKFIRLHDQLPLKGIVKNQQNFWSGDYWAIKLGNINYRWNQPVPAGFHLDSPSKKRLLSMTLEAKAFLAPSEKFDLLNGSYDYPLTSEVAKHVRPDAAEWEGICHGWAPASMGHAEPQPVVMINADGIQIPFGSSDIKALLSYYYAYKYKADNHIMGWRCAGNRWNRDDCNDDLNAGAFHIVLTNMVGIRGKSFIGDLDNGTEVWNHPIYSYQVDVLDANLPPDGSSAGGTVKVVRVRTTMDYVDESEKNTWGPLIGTPDQMFDQKVYTYDLDIDDDGMIIGGDWLSDDRPDFLWLIKPVSKFEGKFTRLRELLED